MIPDGWVKSRLETIAKIIDCKHRTPKYVQEGVPVISPGTIKWGAIDLTSPKKHVTQIEYESLMDHCCVDVGDLVLSRNQSVGIASYIDSEHPFVLGQDTVLIKPQTTDHKFLYFQLQSSELQAQIKKLAGGSTFSRINLSDIRRLRIALPPLSEQKEIAQILTAWDKTIIITEQLLANSQLKKKALMQQLFMGNGLDRREWKIARLGQLTKKVGSGITPKGGSSVYVSSGVPLIRSQNVLWGKLDLSDVVFIEESQHKKMFGSAVQIDDVLLNITGASIGRCCKVPKNLKTSNVNQHVCIIRPKDELSANYLKFFLLSYSGQKQIEQFQAGGNRQGLNFEQIKSFNILLPSLIEQARIASILSAADEEIRAQQQKIIRLKQEKIALMQQLLTGKRRVKLAPSEKTVEIC